MTTANKKEKSISSDQAVIVYLPITDITPYFKNAKEHPEKQIKKIAASIQEFGFNQPIVIDKNKVIIVGHGRWLAGQFLQLDMVPTLTVDLDEEHAKAYRLADNKLNESDWTMETVIEELKTLSLQQLAERALKRSSEVGDIVLDAFGGSGSTLICCEQLKRKARLIELDPKYVDAIVGRWVKYSENPSVIKNGEEIQWLA